jgi:hypothetical protein
MGTALYTALQALQNKNPKTKKSDFRQYMYLQNCLNMFIMIVDNYRNIRIRFYIHHGKQKLPQFVFKMADHKIPVK